MANYFTIPKNAYAGLDALIAIGAEKLALLADEVGNTQLTLSVDDLTKHLSSVIDTPQEQLANAVDRILIPLSGLRADMEINAEQFMQVLSEMAQNQNEAWFNLNHKRLEGISGEVGRLVASNGFFGQLSKAYRLLLNRPALAQSVKVLTELRPVYDDDVTTVQAYLITSTMAVNYQESGQLKRLHLTLDLKDLEQLEEQVERAMRKIDLLEKQVADLGVPSLVAGS